MHLIDKDSRTFNELLVPTLVDTLIVIDCGITSMEVSPVWNEV